MRTKFVEATQNIEKGFNHGKFFVGWFDLEEVGRESVVDASFGFKGHLLLSRCGWTPEHIFVGDLQTGEGAIFFPYGSARADLMKHRIWVCPMFEPFLEWLYKHVMTGENWWGSLPKLVELPDAAPALSGWRRLGGEVYLG